MAAVDAAGDGRVVVVAAGLPEELQAASPSTAVAQTHNVTARRTGRASSRAGPRARVACFVKRFVREVCGREGP